MGANDGWQTYGSMGGGYDQETPNTYFVDCTCEHDPEEHGWGSCDVDGCPCQGGWEE